MKKFLNSSIPQFLNSSIPQLSRKLILTKFLILTSFLMFMLTQLNAQSFSGTVLRDPSNKCNNNQNGAIPGTLITVSGSSTGNSTTTNSNGQYSLTYSSPNPQHDPLTLCASKYGVATDGLTTDDMLAVQDHIQARQCFTEKFQFLAADVNHNNILTSADVNIMNQVYLNIRSDFDYNWYMFYTGEYNGFDIDISGCPSSDLPFEDNCIEVESGGTFNFIAVKVGDVVVNDIDCSAFKKKDKISVRSSEKENIHVDVVKKNEIENNLILNLEHDNLRYVGLELIFNSNNFSVKNIHSNLNNSDLESFEYKVEGNKIRISWINFQEFITKPTITIAFTQLISNLETENPVSLLINSEFNQIIDYKKNYFIPSLLMNSYSENGYSLTKFENNLQIQGSQISSIEIVDLMGRVIKNINYNAPLNIIIVDISTFSGIYFIRINNKIIKKIVL